MGVKAGLPRRTRVKAGKFKLWGYCCGVSVGAGVTVCVGAGVTLVFGAGILTGGSCGGSCADGVLTSNLSDGVDSV